jgi:hypothetical protein
MRLCVAHLGELPPGKGKKVEVEGREITVFNLEGRLVATATRGGHLHGGETTDCSQNHQGMPFDAFAEDSPARLHAEHECRVWLEGEDVWLACD